MPDWEGQSSCTLLLICAGATIAVLLIGLSRWAA